MSILLLIWREGGQLLSLCLLAWGSAGAGVLAGAVSLENRLSFFLGYSGWVRVHQKTEGEPVGVQMGSGSSENGR